MKYALLLASLALAACGSSDKASSDENSSDETIGAEIAADYNSALDKAQNVEDQLLQSKDNLDDALEESIEEE